MKFNGLEADVSIEALDIIGMADLRIAIGSRFPVWVFDTDNSCVCWANEKALVLWNAQTVPELAKRSMANDMSTSVRDRLAQFQCDFWRGATFDEMWTLYPGGEPTPMICRFRGIILDDGRMGMLCEAEAIEGNSGELVQSAQALLYTSAFVSIYLEDGSSIYMNPAARRIYHTLFPKLQDRLANATVAERLLTLQEGHSEGRFNAEVLTVQGVRIHEMDARITFDSATGKRAVIITEIDVTEREKAKKQTAYLAEHDSLTGLKNRSFVETAVEGMIKADVDGEEIFALYFMDLDRFKYVNDTLGHKAGDDLLHQISQRLLKVVPQGSLVSRFGGDEFLVVVKGQSSARDIRQVGRKILSVFNQPFQVAEQQLRVRTSLGVSRFPADAKHFDELLQCADLALYASKERGAQQLCMFRPALAARSIAFQQIDSELSKALDADELMLYFQPRVTLESKKIVGVEALLRWRRADGTMVPPDQFIPIAESTGLINKIGLWVLRVAAKRQMELKAAGYEINFSVNVSAKQFNDPNLVPLLRKLTAMPGFDPKRFELEITETLLVDDNVPMKRTLSQIIQMGFGFSIDDFGTAYSNMAALKNYPIDCIKIDRSLVNADEYQTLTLGVITLGRSLGVKIVAEGVETEVQREWLAKNGCQEFQGWLFSKALPFDDLAKMLMVERAA